MFVFVGLNFETVSTFYYVFLVTFLHAFSWFCESLLHTSFGSHEAVCCTLSSGPMWQYVTHFFLVFKRH